MRLALMTLVTIAAAGCGTAPDNSVQSSSPTEAPPAPVSNEATAAESGARAPVSDSSGESASPCLVQDGKQIDAMKLHAIGTEPFWGADVNGRCVTYSTPENQQGTRVWSQFSGSADNGTWTGFLGHQRFVMRTRAEPGCSDGMSDKRYPVAVTLTIGGEERRGCAERR